MAKAKKADTRRPKSSKAEQTVRLLRALRSDIDNANKLSLARIDHLIAQETKSKGTSS